MKIEKSADAQLGRSFEFALPKEWSRQEQIQYTAGNPFGDAPANDGFDDFSAGPTLDISSDDLPF